MTDEERQKKNEEYLEKVRTMSMDEVIMDELASCCLPGMLDTPYDTLQSIIQWHVGVAEYFKDNPACEEDGDEIDMNHFE